MSRSITTIVGLVGAALGLLVICSSPSVAAEIKKKQAKASAKHFTRPSAQKKLQATRRMLIERMKASREQLNDALPHYEQKLAEQSADYEQKKNLFEKNLISQRELDNSKQQMTNTRLETERVRQLIAEDDIALSFTEEVAQAEIAQLPKLAVGASDRTSTLIRYNGPADWSPEDVDKIANFYRSRFGHPLPVSAMGQSATHDRMGFDHRDAVDVAVSPDSAEGRALMVYLRKSGIPFLAFRGRVARMSTGAHIHIGRPSPRLMEVRQRTNPPSAPEQSLAGG